MKSRNGFVSNSSSSSYVIMIAADKFKKYYDESDDNTKKIVDFLRDGKYNKFIDDKLFMSTAVTIIHSMSDASGEQGIIPELCRAIDELEIEDNDDPEELIYEKWEEFSDKISEDVAAVTTSIGYG